MFWIFRGKFLFNMHSIDTNDHTNRNIQIFLYPIQKTMHTLFYIKVRNKLYFGVCEVIQKKI